MGAGMTGWGRSIAAQSILANYTPKNSQQARRVRSIVLQAISGIYTPKTAGQGARTQEAL